MLGAEVSGQLAIFDDDGGAGCIETAETLCLRTGDRFKVQLSWRSRQGDTGRGQAVPLVLEDSGLFTFFNVNNAEILMKVLNGCNSNGMFWVFFAGTTNQGFTLTVTDTANGTVKYYSNPLGMATEAVLDTRAFETCP